MIVMAHLLRHGFLFSILITAAVPCFFFLSGRTYRYREDLRAYLLRRLKSLMLPYALMGLVSIVLYRIMGKFASETLTSSARPTTLWQDLLHLFYGNAQHRAMNWNNSLWFLPCLFVLLSSLQVFDHILHRFLIRHLSLERPLLLQCILRLLFSLLCVLTGALLIRQGLVYLPWNLETALVMMPFAVLGNLLEEWKARSEAVQKKYLEWKCMPFCEVLISIFFVLAALLFAFRNSEVTNALSEKSWTYVSIRTDDYGSLPLFFGTAFCLILSILLISKRRAPILRLFEKPGRDSLWILLLNKFPIMVLQILPWPGATLLARTDTPEAALTALLLTPICILACLLCSTLFHRCLSFVLHSFFHRTD